MTSEYLVPVRNRFWFDDYRLLSFCFLSFRHGLPGKFLEDIIYENVNEVESDSVYDNDHSASPEISGPESAAAAGLGS